MHIFWVNMETLGQILAQRKFVTMGQDIDYTRFTLEDVRKLMFKQLFLFYFLPLILNTSNLNAP